MTPASSGPGAAARVAAALAAHPREHFLPADQRPHAGYDGPLPIGHGQTNSQPRTVLAMLELLDVRPGHRVLDVGAGSGWTTALLAHLTGPSGSVLGLELVPQLAAVGAANLAARGMPWARLEPADPAVLGAPTQGPFDRVLVSAMATALPRLLVDQLGPDGILVVPVQGVMTRVVRRGGDPPGGDPYEVSEHGRYRFVPLIGG